MRVSEVRFHDESTYNAAGEAALENVTFDARVSGSAYELRGLDLDRPLRIVQDEEGNR